MELLLDPGVELQAGLELSHPPLLVNVQHLVESPLPVGHFVQTFISIAWVKLDHKKYKKRCC